MKTYNIGANYFQNILNECLKNSDAQRIAPQRNLFSQKCAYCGKGYSQNITMQYCSFKCFRRDFGQ